MSKRFQNKVVWITGGGSGIGLEMAKEFDRQGARVAVSGRRKAKLDEAVGQLSDGLAVVCDVTDEAAVETAVAEVVDHFGQLDVVVANAGFGVSGRVEDLSAEDWRRQLDTNVVGAAITAKHSLPHLKATKGRLALVGSVAGVIASPNVGAYHASKYAVRALGQVLSMELHGTGVSCTLIQPGFVKSEIAQVDNNGEFQPEWEDRRPQALMWETDRAARVIVKAIFKRKREFTFTGHGKFVGFLGMHAPSLVHFLVTRFVPSQSDPPALGKEN